MNQCKFQLIVFVCYVVVTTFSFTIFTPSTNRLCRNRIDPKPTIIDREQLIAADHRSRSHLNRRCNLYFYLPMTFNSNKSSKKLEDMSMEELFEEVNMEKQGSKLSKSSGSASGSPSRDSIRAKADKEYESYWKRQDSTFLDTHHRLFSKYCSF